MTPCPLPVLFFLNSPDMVITISIFTDAYIVVYYYVLIARQIYMNYCNITTLITKNLLISLLHFGFIFTVVTVVIFQLSSSTNNSNKNICDRDGNCYEAWYNTHLK